MIESNRDYHLHTSAVITEAVVGIFATAAGAGFAAGEIAGTQIPDRIVAGLIVAAIGVLVDIRSLVQYQRFIDGIEPTSDKL